MWNIQGKMCFIFPARLCLLVDFRNGPLLVRFFSITLNVSPWRRKPMMTTAPHNTHDNTPEAVVLMAFELSEKTWKLGFTIGHGPKSRERTIAARDPKRVLEEV